MFRASSSNQSPPYKGLRRDEGFSDQRPKWVRALPLGRKGLEIAYSAKLERVGEGFRLECDVNKHRQVLISIFTFVRELGSRRQQFYLKINRLFRNAEMQWHED